MDAVLKFIHDPICVYLHQHLTTKGVNMTEPVTEVPEGWTFPRQLPEKVWKTEVWELIMTCFNHLSEAHAHMSSFVAKMLSRDKIADPETFDMVMKASAQLMIQINIPEHYLSPVQDPPPKDDHRRMPILAGESPAPPTIVSCMGTTVWTHPASGCSHLALSQMQVFQWQHHQGGLHYI